MGNDGLSDAAPEGLMSVSVVMPARNAARFIEEAIETVLAQGEAMRELIVVDDGSTDETCAIVRGFSDRRVKLISGAGRGVSAARNTGARAAVGEWLMFLDADDRLRPQALSILLDAAVKDAGVVAVYGDYSRIDARGRRIGVRRWLRRRAKPSGRILEQIVAGNFIVNGGVMIVRADAFAATGGFNERLRYCEDWHCWCRLAALGAFKFVPRLLLDYRVHDASAMSAKARTARDFLPAVNHVFSDAFVVDKVPAELRPRLRQAAELHMIVYAATQAVRFREYRKAFAHIGLVGGPSSAAAPRLVLRLGLALFGL